MAASKSYFEWSINATKLDTIDGTDEEARWRSETKLYDRRLLEEKVAHLRSVRNASKSTVTERIFAVRADLLRNLGNVASAALHEHFPLVPGPIREYIDEVREHLEDITNSTELPLAEKSAFLKETRHAFGRTALVLSGGGALGTFHLGVVKALLEHRLLPRVLAGSSVGAVVCAVAATRTDSELTALLEDISSFDLTFFSHAALPVPAASSTAGKLLGTSSMQLNEDPEQLVKRLRHLLGDVTFVEAYSHTSRVLNLSVSAAGGNEPPRLLNYLTAPHVVVWSAVACSSAFPGLPQPRELLARSVTGELVRFADSNAGCSTNSNTSSNVGGAPATTASPTNTGWRDGSLEDDLPMRGLSEMFGVNHFIVSQTSPHIIPFLNLKKSLGVVGQLAEAEIKHRCRQALEILPRWKWPARWLRAFSQPWEGDVTIALPNAAAQLAKGLIGPSRSALLQAIRQGELSTWAKISAIQCNCGIEATLDACIQQVAAWERFEQKERKTAAASMPLKSGRLPSWADLDSLQQQSCGGVAGSSSAESLYSMSLSHVNVAAGGGCAVSGGVPAPAESFLPKYRVSSHGSLPTAAGVFPSPGKGGASGATGTTTNSNNNKRVSFSKFSSSEADLKHLAVLGIPSPEYMVTSPSPPRSLHSPQALYKKGCLVAPPLRPPSSSTAGADKAEQRVLSPISTKRVGSPLGSAMECIDTSANPFPEGSPSPLSKSAGSTSGTIGTGERRSSSEFAFVNNRNGLDVIAP
jgi:TAG lipase/steryl ester hydrolase/phospholipase A2/LPA acyltransferase